MNEEWYNDRIRMADDPHWVRTCLDSFWQGLADDKLSSDQTMNCGSIKSFPRTRPFWKASPRVSPISRTKLLPDFCWIYPPYPLTSSVCYAISPLTLISTFIRVFLLHNSVRAINRMHVGFTSLREFVLERPSLRAEALQVLLELTTHPG